MRLLTFFAVLLMIFITSTSHASILINEFLADPPNVTGDSNEDGVLSLTDDEFVELVNITNYRVDVSGWTISDNIKIRHLFEEGSIIEPFGFFVLFGGGNPKMPNAQTASSGSLSLNNTADDIYLFNNYGFLVDEIKYGILAGKDQSLNREFDGIKSNFMLHSQLTNANGKFFSPGTTSDGKKHITGANSIPENATLINVLMGLTVMLIYNRDTLRLLVRKL